MGQILGLGITHVPNLAARMSMSARMQKRLEDPALPERLRAVENWPPAMREQWGRDRGETHCEQHRRDLIDQFRRIRAELSGGNDLDPPAPQPWRCLEVGAAVARALKASPWRVAVVASSSWIGQGVRRVPAR